MNETIRRDERRVPLEERKDRSYKEIGDLHREIMRMIVQGKKNVEIAKELGISKGTIKYVRNSHITKAHIAQMQDKADGEVIKMRKRIRNIAPNALQILENIMSDPEAEGHLDASISEKIKVAQDLLDRAGHKAGASLDVTVRKEGDSDWVDSLMDAADNVMKDDDEEGEEEESEEDSVPAITTDNDIEKGEVLGDLDDSLPTVFDDGTEEEKKAFSDGLEEGYDRGEG